MLFAKVLAAATTNELFYLHPPGTMVSVPLEWKPDHYQQKHLLFPTSCFLHRIMLCILVYSTNCAPHRFVRSVVVRLCIHGEEILREQRTALKVLRNKMPKGS